MPFGGCALRFLGSGQVFQLAPPIETVDEFARVTPTRSHFDVKFQKDLPAEHFLDLHACRSADLLEHLPTFAHENRLLSFTLAVDGSGDSSDVCPFLELLDDDGGGVGNLFLGLDENLLAHN